MTGPDRVVVKVECRKIAPDKEAVEYFVTHHVVAELKRQLGIELEAQGVGQH